MQSRQSVGDVSWYLIAVVTMGKSKSQAKGTKKEAGNKSDNNANNKTSAKAANMEAVKLSKEPDKLITEPVKSSKRPAKTKTVPYMYLFLFGLSVVIATAAIIFTNEDIQMYLVKLTHLGSNPLQHIIQSDTVELHNIPKTKQKHSTNQNPGTGDSRQMNNGETDSTLSEDDESSSIHVAEEQILKSKEKRSVTKSIDEEIESIAENMEKEVKKIKPIRKDYEKYNITSKEDYKIRKKLDAAGALLEQDDLTEALKNFDAILKTNPDSPRALWGKAMINDRLAEKQRSNQFLEEGMKLMERAMKLSETPKQLVVTIAKKLAERQTFRGWAGKAVSTWRFLVGKFPDNLVFRRQFGVSFLQSGKNDLARDEFEEILEKDPDDGFSLVHLGFIIKTNDLNYEKAIPLLQRGIESNAPGTNEGKFYYHLGDAYSRINRTDKAYEVYQLGTDRGLFLSPYQRSLYNADTPLTGRPWWTPEQTSYKKELDLLEKHWKTIREEGISQMDLKKGSFMPEEENLREKGDWKQFTLYQRGQKNVENCKKVPKTCALIDQIPDARGCTRGQVKFSVMHPGVHVWPHTGPTNCRIRAHLGLVVPEGPRIRVGDITGTWKEGKFIIFDDSFEHEVWHDGKDFRLVLIIDFWHPELTAHQKRTLAPI